jgi:tetratricopeptide (TPR) repeat protein
MRSSIRSLTRRAGAATLAALLLATNAPAGAPESAEKARAREHFEVAQTAYDLGRFDEALAGYSEAYRLTALPGFLFNIAQCHRQLGNDGQALFFYNRYLDLAPGAKNEALARRLVRELEARQAARERQARRDSARKRELDSKVSLVPTGAEAAAETASNPGTPLLQQWWLWAGVGMVAAAVATTAAVVALSSSSEPQPRR